MIFFFWEEGDTTYHTTIARSPCEVFLALTLAGVSVTRVGYD